MSGLQQVQSRYLGEIERDFYPLPIFRGGWANTEMVGLPQLSALARTLFGDQYLGQIFHRGAAQTLEESGEDFLLRLPLPHLELNKVKLTKRGDELFVTIGNFKRELLLPAVLAQRNAGRANPPERHPYCTLPADRVNGQMANGERRLSSPTDP